MAPPVPDELFDLMDVMHDGADDMGDGAWQAFMQDTVEQYNTDNNTDFDPYDTFIEWVKDRGEP